MAASFCPRSARTPLGRFLKVGGNRETCWNQASPLSAVLPLLTRETTIRLSVGPVIVDGVVKLNVCCAQLAPTGWTSLLASTVPSGFSRLTRTAPVHVPLAKKLPVYLVDGFAATP